MFKAIIAITRRPDIDAATFREHYLNRHAAIVARMPGLRRYQQNVVLPGPDGREPDISGIAEVVYDDVQAFRAAMASPVAAEANASLSRFTDTAKMQVFFVEEVVLH